MASITEENDDNSFPDIGDDDMSNPEMDEEDEEEDATFKNDSVTRLLQQLQNSGAIKKVEKVNPPLSIPFSTTGLSFKSEGFSIKPFKPKAPHCNKCDMDFEDTDELKAHLVEHVKLPFIVLEKLQSDDEDDVDTWSDEEIEQEIEIPAKKIANENILKKLGGGISINKPVTKDNTIILNTGGLKTIAKIVPPNPKLQSISPKLEPTENPSSPMERITSAGSLKLTIKQSSGKDNFQVIDSNNKNCNVDIKVETPAPGASVLPSSTTAKSWETVDIKEGILDSNFIKKEPTITEIPNNIPALSLPVPPTRIKDEPRENIPSTPALHVPAQPIIPQPMIIPKKEPEPAVAIIEINGDDSDNDDIMFVDATPPIPKKPTIGVIPTAQITDLPSSGSSFSNQLNSPLYSSNSTSRTPTTPISSVGSTEKQHNFNWNAPSKTLESMLKDKNPDAIFQSLLESHRKDNNSDLGASEYISLDTLGPKHTCDVCQTRFTDLRLLENHKRATGHSNQIVTAGASGNNSIVPSGFGGNSSLLAMNNLFPVKQLAEVAGKLAGASNARFSQQQNIMVNIHSFPPNIPQMPGYTPQMSGYQPGYRMPDPNQSQYPYPPSGYPQYPAQPGAPPYPNSQMPGYPQHYPQQQPYPNHGQYPPGPNNDMMGQPNQHGHPGHMMGQPGQPMNQQMPGQPMNQQMPGHPGAIPTSLHDSTGQQSPSKIGMMGGIKIQNTQAPTAGLKLSTAPGTKLTGLGRGQIRLPVRGRGGAAAGRGAVRPMGGMRPGGPGQMIRGGGKTVMRTPIKRPGDPSSSPNTTPTKKRLDMLLPDRNDNEDCHVVAMQKQRDGVPFIESIKGRQESMQLGSGLTVTKTKVVRQPSPPPQTKDANAVANMLAQRGIKITAKYKPPSPPPIAIPNLGSDICIKKKPATSSSLSSFHIPEDKDNSLSLKCDMCHMSYASFSQLQEHKRQFHNVKSEMGLPVVDLSNESNLIRLSNLGIMNFIPLANREQSGGCYGIPIVSVHNALNGSLNTSLQSLGAGGILSLGPVKPLPKC